MLVEDLTSTKARPDFFPILVMWSAMFVQARATAPPSSGQGRCEA